MADLIRGLFSDARELAVAHIDGVRIEVRQEVSALKKTSMVAAVGVAMFTLAGFELAGSAVQALQIVMPGWASHLIIGGALGLTGLIALAIMRVEAPRELVPPELHRAEEDARWVVRRTREAVT